MHRDRRSRNKKNVARDFSCAVSGFGQVLKSDPRFAARVFGLRPKTCRPAADEAPRYTREKISGTQGTQKFDRFQALRNNTQQTDTICNIQQC